MAARDDRIDWTPVRREALERQLRRHCQAEVRFDPGARVLYSTDASIYQIEPIGVVIPRTQEDLRTIVAIAMEQRVPLVPRGGGTSLSGQAIGPGLVIDFRKYLHCIYETNLEERWVRVEPGVVLAELNRVLEPHGFQFGPDVATIDRATIGGMIANNSAGARSIKYGKTSDHLLELDVLLSDGRPAVFRKLSGLAGGSAGESTGGPGTSASELNARLRLPGREGEIYRTVRQVVLQHRDEIARRYPKVLRRVSGYNLDQLIAPDDFDLTKLVAGSEGTLAVVAGARLRIVPLPRCRGISAVHFERLDDALAALGAILATGPSAVELLDQLILEMARENPEFCRRVDFVRGRPEALFIVEHSADDHDALERAFADVRANLAGTGSSALVQSQDAVLREHMWNVRQTALPLLLSMPGRRRPITFVEDTAVAPERLRAFVARFRSLLERHGAEGSFYGHASVGCLHIRPFLDLRSLDGRRDMVCIAEEVVDLVLEFEGALSGEHGDGLARSAFNRKLFGPELYQAFRTIKAAFDPENLLNPGKIVDAPGITDHLRAALGPLPAVRSVTFTSAEDSLAVLVHNCNGNGLCRREGVGVMCPSYMALREEEHSPRGRANLLRAALEGRLGAGGPDFWAVPELDNALDLCLMCKACQTECPSRVDVARLKAEFLQQRMTRRQPRWRDRLIADLARGSRLGARWAPVSNWVLRAAPVRWCLHAFLGIDRRRKLPAYQRRTLEHWFARHPSGCPHPRGEVVLLADCFTNYHEPWIGRDAVALLEAAGYQVHLATLCCARTLISKGFLEQARRTVAEGAARLLPYVERGLPVLGIEPSCILTLTDEWRKLVPGEATTQIARQTQLAESFLLRARTGGGADLPAGAKAPANVLFHGHCHQKAAGAVPATVAALEQLSGTTACVLDSGCCGMAGSFGYEREHYDLSVAIAESRLLPALRQQPDLPIVASGFSCRSQIADLLHKRALHPVEWLRQRILPPER